MNLFIIGNGFDLGHDLPTSYWDFRSFLEKKHPAFLNDFEEKYYLWGHDLKTSLWNNIEFNLANIQDDVLYNQMDQSSGLRLEIENVDIEDTLTYYFGEQFKFIEKLTLYLEEWIAEVNEELPDTNRRTSLIKESSSDKFITFNYTTTLEEIYKIENVNILHIHGVVNSEDELVLGHSNLKRIDYFRKKYREFQNKGNTQISPIYSALSQYCINTYKDVRKYIPKLFSLNYNSVEKIMIIGHSLSDVDLPYFAKIKGFIEDDIAWCVYYYCEDEAAMLKKQLKKIDIQDRQIHMIPASEFYDLHS